MVKEATLSTALNSSLIKALHILDLFGPERPELSAKVVSESLDMNVATAHRFLLTLEHAGHLVSPRRGQFTLGQKLEDLGRLASEISPLPQLARPVVEAISRDLDESVMACRMGRFGPLCVASANSSRPIRVSVDVGTTLPLSTTAQGKLFLAAMSGADRSAWISQDPSVPDLTDLLDQVQKQGFATNFGENEAEIGAVAVPVKSADGRTVLTLSLFGILSAFDGVLVERGKQRLREGAATLEASIRTRSKQRLAQEARS